MVIYNLTLVKSTIMFEKHCMYVKKRRYSKIISFVHEMFNDVAFEIITEKKVSWSPLLQCVRIFFDIMVYDYVLIFSRVKMLV